MAGCFLTGEFLKAVLLASLPQNRLSDAFLAAVLRLFERVSIDQRGVQGGMPKELLRLFQRASIQEVQSRCRMAEAMRRQTRA